MVSKLFRFHEDIRLQSSNLADTELKPEVTTNFKIVANGYVNIPKSCTLIRMIVPLKSVRNLQHLPSMSASSLPFPCSR